jgi:hypothetical protein
MALLRLYSGIKALAKEDTRPQSPGFYETINY